VKKITIFLDIDGVLHSTQLPLKKQFECLPILVKSIEPFLNQIEIVISSSWRFHFDIADLAGLFPTTMSAVIVNTTGDAHIGKFARYFEIKNYVRDFAVKKWIAIDDSQYEFPDPLPCNIILCNPRFGFTTHEAKRLIKILEN
jgi:hypothetical protein